MEFRGKKKKAIDLDKTAAILVQDDTVRAAIGDAVYVRVRQRRGNFWKIEYAERRSVVLWRGAGEISVVGTYHNGVFSKAA